VSLGLVAALSAAWLAPLGADETTPRPPRLRHAPSSPLLLDLPLVELRASLATRIAGGDGDAAYLLAHALARCAVERAAPPPTVVELCRGDERPSLRDWWRTLELAAQLGSLEATSEYLDLQPPLMREVSMSAGPTPEQTAEMRSILVRRIALAQVAAERGSLAAIVWQAWALRGGMVLAGEELLARDPVGAYARFRAAALIRAAAGYAPETAAARTTATLDANAATALEAELSPERRTEAEAIARWIVTAPECCLVQP